MPTMMSIRLKPRCRCIVQLWFIASCSQFLAYDAAFTIGGSLLVGIVISTLGSAGVVNPAVALGVSAYTSANWWTTGVYAIAPVVGGVAGAWLYKLMQWDTLNMGKKK